MNRTGRVSKLRFKRKACIFQPTLIDEIHGTVGPKAPSHRGNGVDDEPHALFNRIRCRFSITVVRFISTRPHGDHQELLQCNSITHQQFHSILARTSETRSGGGLRKRSLREILSAWESKHTTWDKSDCAAAT